jgi:alpha-beta hydrolase superfamily lysophospholipase
VKDRMSARFAAGLNQLVARVGPAAGRVERPILILHGEADPICSPLGSQRFHTGLTQRLAQTSALRIYPDLRHEIFQEPERKEIWQEMLDWLDK